MNSRRTRAAVALVLGLLSGTMLADAALAQSNSQTGVAAGEPASPWDQRVNPVAAQADAWFDNYKFRDGETLAHLKIHYSTLGEPHRNTKGEIDNAVLVL